MITEKDIPNNLLSVRYDDSVKYMIREKQFIINTIETMHHLKVILDGISNQGPSEFDLDLIIQLERLRCRLNESETQYDSIIQCKTFINKIITIFKQRT